MMLRTLAIAAVLACAGPAVADEKPVDPYMQSNANAGVKPFAGDRLLQAFHGAAGVGRIVDELLEASKRTRAPPRSSKLPTWSAYAGP